MTAVCQSPCKCTLFLKIIATFERLSLFFFCTSGLVPKLYGKKAQGFTKNEGCAGFVSQKKNEEDAILN
jgi:hypothetical protein